MNFMTDSRGLGHNGDLVRKVAPKMGMINLGKRVCNIKIHYAFSKPEISKV